MHKLIHILIVDDHPLMAGGLQDSLPSTLQFQSVLAHSVLESFTALENRSFDLLIVDYRLQDGTGLEIIKRARKVNVKACILITSFEESGIFREALRLGCLGLLMKTSGSEKLKKCIEEVLSGNKYLDPKIEQMVMQQQLGASTTSEIVLTSREKEVIFKIAEGLNTTKIAEVLFISENTVESHRKHIIQKTGAKNSAELIRIAMEKGWI
jgi:DNA-binding NarL/FixJ family response regulator